MKKILALPLLLLSFAASAGLTSDATSSAGFNQLTEAQKAEVIKTIAQQAESNRDSPAITNVIPDPDGVERWTKIGTSVAAGLGAAARELNVGVNEFAKSPVGQLTTVLIVWKLIGAQLIHVLGGILVWIVGIIAIRHIISRQTPDQIVYSSTDKNIFGNYVIVKRNKHSLNHDEAGGYVIGYVVVLVFGLMTMFTF